ncbi:hypothetical protein [Lignipirellula cremea]|uniref:hypothetical protein n=1 Tax=Lignipirellula cremea TaxID=2528010 RepID=UPI0011A9EA9E|nr:hypothetical protein [Lignipirellula cremea]
MKAPEGWGGETIALPPGFAPGMGWQGTEKIRFAPGMMKPEADGFFSYAFAFELRADSPLTEAEVQKEFLAYYRGLCQAVLRGKLPGLDPAAFTLQLKRQEAAPGDPAVHYTGVLDWIEPFATRKPQRLNLEIQTWSGKEQKYVFVCVSPQDSKAAIWKELHGIRDDYRKQQPAGDE